jgi:membrane protein
LPSALVAAVGFHVGSAGFALYLEHLADFDDVYGPLGAVLAFLMLVYVAAAVMLVGATVAAAWPTAEAPEPPRAAVPLRRRVQAAARGLLFRDRSR